MLKLKTVPILIYIILLSINTAVCQTAESHAGSNTVDIEVYTTVKPAYAVGIIVSPGKTIERKDVSHRRLSDSVLIVTVPYFINEVTNESFATAMVVDSEGNTFFGSVKPLFIKPLLKSFYDMPKCDEKISEAELKKALLIGDIGMLESLKEIREQRRALLQTKIKRLMSDQFLEKHTKLEQSFGFSYTTPLTPETNPVEMIGRLNRMLIAIRNLKSAMN